MWDSDFKRLRMKPTSHQTSKASSMTSITVGPRRERWPFSFDFKSRIARQFPVYGNS